MRIYITKSELKNSLSLNGRRVLITLSEICEAMSVSENTVRPLINGLTKFKFTDNGRKLWYSVDEVTNAVWGCRI